MCDQNYPKVWVTLFISLFESVCHKVVMMSSKYLFEGSEAKCYDQQEKSFLIGSVKLLEARNLQN